MIVWHLRTPCFAGENSHILRIIFVNLKNFRFNLQMKNIKSLYALPLTCEVMFISKLSEYLFQLYKIASNKKAEKQPKRVLNLK